MSDRTRRRALLAAMLLAPLAARSGYQVREWPPRQATPAFALDDLDRRSWRVADLRGRPVLLNFWATWCEPCRAEMPSLELLAERHRADGLLVLAVNFRESELTVRRFLEKFPISLPIVLDPQGATTKAWTPGVFPNTVLIDRQGRPRRTIVGEVDWMGDEARPWMNELLRNVS
ncbi:MAG: TlpA disulfide reductase family protein [Burkholderiaceae bacterium]